MTSRFICTDIKRNIQKWTRACVNCKENKISRHTKTDLGTYNEPDERFSVVHIHIIGPYPSNDCAYCLTCIDRYTSSMEVVPLPNITAETVAKAFYEIWITRFGVLYQVITDRGMQFTSELFRTLANTCGVKIQHTTVYHPQCNGKIERLRRTLKGAVRAHNPNGRSPYQQSSYDYEQL